MRFTDFHFHLLEALWDSLTQLLLHWGNQHEHRKRKDRAADKAPIFEGPSHLEALDDLPSGNAPDDDNSGTVHDNAARDFELYNKFVVSAPRVSRYPSLLLEGTHVHNHGPITRSHSTSRGFIYPHLSRTNSRDWHCLK